MARTVAGYSAWVPHASSRYPTPQAIALPSRGCSGGEMESVVGAGKSNSTVPIVATVPIVD